MLCTPADRWCLSACSSLALSRLRTQTGQMQELPDCGPDPLVCSHHHSICTKPSITGPACSTPASTRTLSCCSISHPVASVAVWALKAPSTQTPQSP